MIKLSQLNGKQGRIVRETTAPFTYVDETDGQVTKPFRVRYVSLSTAEQMEQKKKLEASDNGGGVAYWSEILLPILVDFPDLIDDSTNLPVLITKELLDGINGVNLQSIYNAIREAPLPKLPASK